MTADRDVLIDAGREGHDSGRITERAAVVEWLREQARIAHERSLRVKDPKQRANYWRRWVALFSVADQIATGGYLRSTKPPGTDGLDDAEAPERASRRIEASFDADPETAAWFSDFLRRLLMGEATDPDWEAYQGIRLSGQAWSSEPAGTAATG